MYFVILLIERVKYRCLTPREQFVNYIINDVLHRMRLRQNICVRACVRVCDTFLSLSLTFVHDSFTKDSFEGIISRHQQSTRMKVHKKPCHTVFALDVAGRLLNNAFYVKLTEDQVRISLKRTFMYFPWFFILPSS